MPLAWHACEPLFAALIFESEGTSLASPPSLAVSSPDLYSVLGL